MYRHYKIYYDDGAHAETVTFKDKSGNFIETYLKQRIAAYNHNINISYHITRKNIQEVTQ